MRHNFLVRNKTFANKNSVMYKRSDKILNNSVKRKTEIKKNKIKCDQK